MQQRRLTNLKDMLFPVPPVAEQIRIVSAIQDTFSKLDSFNALQSEQIVGLTQLDQSILAKAFRGELVPQDPTDEPAHILLDRIRAEREKTQKAKKKTKRKKKN